MPDLSSLSLKELIEKRNKCVHDARDILGREKAAGRKLYAEEVAKAEGLLDLAAEVDDAITAKVKSDERNKKLSALEDREQEPARRQIPASIPGINPPAKGGDGAAILEWRGQKIHLAKGTPEHARCSKAYHDAYLSYLIGASTGASLGLQVGKDPKGGYLAPMSFVANLIKFLDNSVFMRQLCTVLPPMANGVSLGVPSWDADPGDADWTAEVPASDITEDDTAAIGQREFVPHLLTKLLKISNKLLRASVLDIESLLVSRLGYKFAVTEEKAFLTGSGAQQPLGVFVASANGINTDRDTACASQTTFTADELINCLYSLKEGYQRNATWLMSRTGIKIARKLKDSQNQYLWQPGLGGQPGTILDRPYVMSEYVPSTYTTGLYVAAVGDWKACYWIADGLDLEFQRLNELFSLRNQVGLLARKETDGTPVLPEAAARLILA